MSQPMPQKLINELPAYFPESLAQRGKIMRLRRGEYLFHRGEAVTWLSYILEGELKAVRAQPEGAECVMVRGVSGEFFAESSLATDRYVCDGIAVCATRLLLVPADEVRQTLCQSNDFALGFALAIARQARKQCSRYERVRLKRARDRVLHFLACESSPEGIINLSAPMVDLACELALEPETLYRTLAELETEGFLERNNRQLRVIGMQSHEVAGS